MMNKKRIMAGAAAFLLAVTGVATDAGIARAAEENSNLPARFDLREQGVVTPVKSQSPFGTCWAFGEIAAAETSILSSLGETYASYPLDLSEKHLVWFALHPVTADEDPTQAGEGLYPFDEEDPYNTGGLPIFATSLFASGCGPTMESQFSYRGEQGITEYSWMLNHKEEWISQRQEALYTRFKQELPKESDDKFSQFCEYKYGVVL